MQKNLFWKVITQMGSVFFMIVPVSIFFVITKDYLITINLIILLILTDGAASFIKLIYFKDRPEKMEYKNIIQRLLASSFPSIHSSRTFSIFLYSLIIFGISFFPIIFFIYFLLVALSRIALKKHFLQDVLGGVLLSTLIFVVYINYFQVYGNFRIQHFFKI